MSASCPSLAGFHGHLSCMDIGEPERPALTGHFPKIGIDFVDFAVPAANQNRPPKSWKAKSVVVDTHLPDDDPRLRMIEAAKAASIKANTDGQATVDAVLSERLPMNRTAWDGLLYVIPFPSLLARLKKKARR